MTKKEFEQKRLESLQNMSKEDLIAYTIKLDESNHRYFALWTDSNRRIMNLEIELSKEKKCQFQQKKQGIF